MLPKSRLNNLKLQKLEDLCSSILDMAEIFYEDFHRRSWIRHEMKYISHSTWIQNKGEEYVLH